MTEVDRLAAEVREQNQLYEKGETDKAFWLAQQNRLKAIQAADPKLTQAAIGEKVGKGVNWVSKVLKWEFSRGRNPFADAANPSKQGTAPVRTALQDPARRRQVFKSLTPQEKADAASDLLAEPEVIEDVVSRPGTTRKAITEAVQTQEYKDAVARSERAKHAATQAQAPTPLPQFFWRIVGKMNEWTRSLMTIADLMGEPGMEFGPDQIPEVLRKHKELQAQVVANIGVLEGRMTIGEDIIDGKVVDVTAKALKA